MMKDYEIGLLDSDSQNNEFENSTTNSLMENQLSSTEVQNDLFSFGKRILIFGVGFILIPVVCYLLFFYK